MSRVDTNVGWFDDDDGDDDYEDILIPNGPPVLYLHDPMGPPDNVQTFIGWGPGIQYFTNWCHGYQLAVNERERARVLGRMTGYIDREVWLAPEQIKAAIHSIAEDN